MSAEHLISLALQTWQKKGWKSGSFEGTFLQLEFRVSGKKASSSTKRLWFVPTNASHRSVATPAEEDPDVFGLLPTLLR